MICKIKISEEVTNNGIKGMIMQGNKWILDNNSILQKIFFGLTILTFGAFHGYFFFLFNRLFMTSFESIQSTSSAARLLQSAPQLGFDNSSESQFLMTQKRDKFGQEMKINQIFYFNLMNALMIDNSKTLRGKKD
jgi:hypothetical protein